MPHPPGTAAWPGKVSPAPEHRCFSSRRRFLGLERAREGSGEGEDVEIAGKCMQMLVEDACPRH